MRNPKDVTILIVDDEAGLRKALRFDFHRAGYNVLEAACGKDAFETVQKTKVDVVLTDVRMPNGDGIELLEKIKARDAEVPVVIFITGFADIALEDAYDKGADAIFSKPFDRKSLQAAVRKVITEKDEKWGPRGNDRFDVDFKIQLSFPDMKTAVEGKVLNLGRGGIFVALERDFPSVDAPVLFSIQFERGSPKAIDGSGTIRWVRASAEVGRQQGCGIEFDRLSDESRRDVIAIIHELKMKAFIPNT